MKRTTRPEGRDFDIGSQPVETNVYAEVTKATEVKIPRAQAVWVAIPLSVAVVVTIIAPIALGPRIFYAVTGVCALAAFLWSLAYETTWMDRITLPFLAGIVAWCFWRFADFAGWRVPETWQPIPALVAVGSLIFWWTFTGAMWLTMWQRLGMPMYHQQYSVWKAAGNLIEHWGKRERAEAQEAPEEPPMRFEMVSAGGRVRHHVDAPHDKDTMQWIARVLSEETFSESSLCGPDKPLPGGVGGRTALDELRVWMILWDLLRWNRTNGDGEPIRTQGVTLTANGLRWVGEVGG